MARNSELTAFVRDALIAGRNRGEIENAMIAAGWGERDARDALATFADTPFIPPVPKPVPQIAARDAFVFALLFAALGCSAGYFISLAHVMLETWLPDASDPAYWEARQVRRVRWAIAILVVAGPLYLWLTMRVAKATADDPGKRHSPVRKWLTYIALFAAGLSFMGDAVYVIYTFLSGEMTLRFVLKALVVALVAGGIFAFYLRDVEEAGSNG